MPASGRLTGALVALSFAAVVAGCGGGGRPIPFENVTASLHGFQPPRLVRELFVRRSELADYLRHSDPGAAIRIPNIDWTRREAILVSSGPRSSSGYSLSVVSLRRKGGRIVLTLREQTPTLGEPVQARVTYPSVLLTIPRMEGSLLLHFRGRP
jgi:hypothetical protein